MAKTLGIKQVVLAMMGFIVLSFFYGCYTSPSTGSRSGSSRELPEPAVPTEEHSGIAAISNSRQFLRSSLEKGESISLLVLFPIDNIKIHHSISVESVDDVVLEQFATQVVNQVTRDYLSDFESFDFSIVSRSSIDRAIEELNLQSTGLINQETQAKIGAFVGASHMMIYQRDDYHKYHEDDEYWSGTRTYYWEIIDIETMSIKSADQLVFYQITEEDGRYFYRIERNDKLVVQDPSGDYYYP